MLKSVTGIYNQGKITLAENPNDIPANTQVIVTFLINSQVSEVQNQEYHDLDYLAGTWTEDDEKEFLKNTKHYNKIDPSLW
jgi:hypothetical protein